MWQQTLPSRGYIDAPKSKAKGILGDPLVDRPLHGGTIHIVIIDLGGDHDIHRWFREHLRHHMHSVFLGDQLLHDTHSTLGEK